jgi:hypothetical protein
MSMIMQKIMMKRLRRSMNKLSPDLQENNNYNERELLFIPENLLIWAIGMEVMIVAKVEEEVLDIEGAKVLNMMRSNQLHGSCVVYTIIFRRIVQAKLKGNYSRTLRLVELDHSVQKV